MVQIDELALTFSHHEKCRVQMIVLVMVGTSRHSHRNILESVDLVSVSEQTTNNGILS